MSDEQYKSPSDTSHIEIKVHRLNGRVISGTPVAQQEVVEQPKQVAAPVVSAGQPKSGTKLEQALVIYKNLTDKSRKNVIATFVKELNMTPAGASTYQYTCKKQLGE